MAGRKAAKIKIAVQRVKHGEKPRKYRPTQVSHEGNIAAKASYTVPGYGCGCATVRGQFGAHRS